MMPLIDIVAFLSGQSRIVERNTQRSNVSLEPINSEVL